MVVDAAINTAPWHENRGTQTARADTPPPTPRAASASAADLPPRAAAASAADPTPRAAAASAAGPTPSAAAASAAAASGPDVGDAAWNSTGWGSGSSVNPWYFSNGVAWEASRTPEEQAYRQARHRARSALHEAKMRAEGHNSNSNRVRGPTQDGRDANVKTWGMPVWGVRL